VEEEERRIGLWKTKFALTEQEVDALRSTFEVSLSLSLSLSLSHHTCFEACLALSPTRSLPLSPTIHAPRSASVYSSIRACVYAYCVCT